MEVKSGQIILVFCMLTSTKVSKGQSDCVPEESKCGLFELLKNLLVGNETHGHDFVVGRNPDGMEKWSNVSKHDKKRNVSAPHIISQTIQHVHLAGRNNTDLLCEVRGSTHEMKIEWTANHIDSEELEKMTSAPSELFRVLRIPILSKRNDGNFTCTVTNHYGTDHKIISLKVVETKHDNFEIYAYFVGTILTTLLIILCCAFSCGRYCFTRSCARKLKTHMICRGRLSAEGEDRSDAGKIADDNPYFRTSLFTSPETQFSVTRF